MSYTPVASRRGRSLCVTKRKSCRILSRSGSVGWWRGFFKGLISEVVVVKWIIDLDVVDDRTPFSDGFSVAGYVRVIHVLELVSDVRYHIGL